MLGPSNRCSAPRASRQAGNLGFEDKLRGNMDAAEYKHVVLGLIFLKYISDAFLEKHDRLIKESSNPKSEYFVKEEQASYGIAEDRDGFAEPIPVPPLDPGRSVFPTNLHGLSYRQIRIDLREDQIVKGCKTRLSDG